MPSLLEVMLKADECHQTQPVALIIQLLQQRFISLSIGDKRGFSPIWSLTGLLQVVRGDPAVQLQLWPPPP